MSEMSFYDVKTRSKVQVRRSKVSVTKTRRGQPMLVTTHNGRKLYKFIKRADVAEYSSST